MSKNTIRIKGAKVNNLKNIDLEIPRDKMVVFTGLSGSGKSSLAFDTIYAEGQRRYVESLSSYARQFLGQMDKPDVEYIDGLSPSISIDQKTTNRNPRSTVGTVTEIYDYLRLLFAKIGIPKCPVCGTEIKSQSIDQMVDRVMKLEERSKIFVLAPVIRGKKGEHKKLLENIKIQGFVRAIIDDKEYELTDEIELDKNKKHNIDIVVDRLVVKEGIESRLTESLETAFKFSESVVKVKVVDGEEIMFSEKMSCPNGHIYFDEIEPRTFSFNSPFGMCHDCNGLGSHKIIDPDLVIPDRTKSLLEGAIECYNMTTGEDGYYYKIFNEIIKYNGFDENTPFKDLSKETIDELFYGTGSREVKFKFESKFTNENKTFNKPFEGIIKNLERRYASSPMSSMREKIETVMSEMECETCKGKRLNEKALSVFIRDKNISDVTAMSVQKLNEWFNNLELTETESIIGERILKEIRERLKFLKDVGLEYLTLARSAGTLSGGESQRIRLATQIGSGLVGVVYVLDEPSIGLHQRDNEKLLNALRNLTNLGNTLIVVEHDEDTIRCADYIVDIGPRAGIHGGEVVAQGTLKDIMKSKKSITGAYLSGKSKIEVPKERRKYTDTIKVFGAKENNLKNIDVEFPIGVFTCVTGVSGSGKSSLVNSILNKELSNKLNRSKQKTGKFDRIEGYEKLDKVIEIDQSPIGRTPRSNPATYTKVFDNIRDVFAMTTKAKMKGYSKGRFSFNVHGGRCEACKGDGTIKVEMHFLPDVYVPCEVCGGKRYNRETLEVTYNGKNISEVLEMTVEDGLEFFENHPSIKRKLQTLYDVGLDYIKIGQSSTELSGGEAQRVKLASELAKRGTGQTVYILDEPTTGLHIDDIKKLIEVLNTLVEQGNTVIVIEHNLDMIKIADHIIDLGVEGGDGGGTIVVTGTPEEVAKCEKSYTGQFLKRILGE